MDHLGLKVMAGVGENSPKRAFLTVVLVAAFGALFLLSLKDPEEFSKQIVPQPFDWASKHGIYLERTSNRRTTTIITPVNKTPSKLPLNYLINNNSNALHEGRKAHVKRICAKYGRNPSEDINVNLMYADKYKLAYKNIPKIGSTFLTQMFSIIVNGADKAEEIFGTKRMKVHMQTKGLYKRLGGDELGHVLTLIPTRNPYTRLYSAYVDKVYLPLAASLASAASRYDNTSSRCGVNTTFESFLKYALRQGGSKALGDHYNSPFSVSRFVCKMDNFMLVKQESFSSDVEYALQKVGVDTADWEVLHSALHDRRAEATVPGIVRTIYTKAGHVSRACFPWNLVAYRTWHAFQLQGFISNKSKFPFGKYSNKPELYADADYLVNLILETIKGNPLSSAERKQQRKDAFLFEYKKVEPKLISNVKSLYAMDFEVYDYNLDWKSAVK